MYFNFSSSQIVFNLTVEIAENAFAEQVRI